MLKIADSTSTDYTKKDKIAVIYAQGEIKVVKAM